MALTSEMGKEERHTRGSKSQRKERACQEVCGNTARWVEHRGAWDPGRKEECRRVEKQKTRGSKLI